MRKPQVGETVYLEPINNAARRTGDVLERKVKSVGRKYFYVWDGIHDFDTMQIHIDTMIQNGNGYMGNWKVYLSLQEIADEKEQRHLSAALRDLFAGWSRNGLTLDQLRRIKAITEEGKGDE